MTPDHQRIITSEHVHKAGSIILVWGQNHHTEEGRTLKGTYRVLQDFPVAEHQLQSGSDCSHALAVLLAEGLLLEEPLGHIEIMDWFGGDKIDAETHPCHIGTHQANQRRIYNERKALEQRPAAPEGVPPRDTFTEEDARTKFMPILSPENKDCFVTDIPAKEFFDFFWNRHYTAPLRMGVAIDLAGISLFPKLVANKMLDPRATIDPSWWVENLYFQVGTQVVKLAVGHRPYSRGSCSPENRCNSTLQLKHTFTINHLTRTVDGSPLDLLADLGDMDCSDLALTFEYTTSGLIYLEHYSGKLTTTPLKLVSIQNQLGDQVKMDVGTGLWLYDRFTDEVTAVGYDLNMRFRG
jgi:hypothetical protein